MLPQELLRQEGGDTIPLCAVRKGSERPKRKRLRRAVGPAAGGWNEAAGDGKQPLWHSCLWKHDGCSGPLSERTEKYRLAESLRLHLHPYNLGEVLHLWLPKSILSLFRVKIQLGYDNSLQILRSGFPAILGGEMVNNKWSQHGQHMFGDIIISTTTVWTKFTFLVQSV